MTHTPTTPHDRRDHPAPSRLWATTIGCLLIAASTGAWLRYAVLHGLPFGLAWTDVRHAHSHLMFFAWVTPALFVLAFEAVDRTGRGRWLAWAAVAAGAAAFVPFLLDGYHLTDVAGRRLPLSMIASSLNVLVWYAFAVVWWSRPRGGPPVAGHALDAATFLLIFASLGAVGLAAVGMAPWASPVWMTALVDFFLGSFAQGWFGLGVLGLAYAARPDAAHGRGREASIDLLVAGLVAGALARLALDGGAATGGAASVALVVTSLANAAAGTGLLLATAPLLGAERRRGPSLWTVPLALLAVKGAVDLASTWPEVAAFVARPGLRVLELHAYLLGVVTLALLAAAHERWGRGAPGGSWTTVAAVLLMLAGLVPISGIWPLGLSGPWMYPLAIWTGFAPIVAIAATWAFRARSHRPVGRGGEGSEGGESGAAGGRSD